jgi:quercetin dioxygenase-like cupin family protein
MSKYFVTQSECSKHTIFKGVDIFTTHLTGVMLSVVEMQPGAVVEEHSHPHEQMGMLISGDFTFTIGDETRHVQPGEMWRIPGGIRHKVIAGPNGAKALDVFQPIREDYK